MYHIYNQGNNRETLFHTDSDYVEFLRLFKKHISGNCQVLAWCLMPNHFHFLVYATDNSINVKRIGNIELNSLSNGFRLLQSSYAQYLNKKTNRTGSLFRQKTKSKAIAEGDKNYSFTAIQYIHQNPLRAGLVLRLEDWPYSSFPDFADLRKGKICDKMLAKELIGFDSIDFIKESYGVIDDTLLQYIF